MSSWRGNQPLAGNRCATLEAQEAPSGAGTQPLAWNATLAVIRRVRREKSSVQEIKVFRFIGCYSMVAFGVLLCFIMIIIVMIMIIIMIFFIIIIVIITQPLAGHFADRVSQPL